MAFTRSKREFIRSEHKSEISPNNQKPQIDYQQITSKFTEHKRQKLMSE